MGVPERRGQRASHTLDELDVRRRECTRRPTVSRAHAEWGRVTLDDHGQTARRVLLGRKGCHGESIVVDKVFGDYGRAFVENVCFQ